MAANGRVGRAVGARVRGIPGQAGRQRPDGARDGKSAPVHADIPGCQQRRGANALDESAGQEMAAVGERQSPLLSAG